ncbi:MAG TPA: Asp-tRNA(Asn)/Glu-tRNA(Gln) amidotransferase subunit GatB [Rhabdochlamydiaceae bacterium]|nr:Asp-tRNA(Asn)/Glu-tRNA(Gln) amidotransferase subunit GatB [Rhabdochlamydiaceae bacterium]
MNFELWEPVIGLEIHVQLNTKSKLFSRAPNRFGDEPNTNISETDTGQPGSLPVLNKEVVRKAVQFGLAAKATIRRISSFDRKSYFYPDSPRNFQITQFYEPLIQGGTITCDVGGHTRHFSLNRAHIEDDTGMLKHFTGFAAIDYNRAGVPLIEIVSEPCIFSPKEATAYAMSIKSIMEYLDASDCNMEEGSLRIDVNISVRLKTEKILRPKIEIKNLNSFHYMELALEAEFLRQVRAYTMFPHENHKVAVAAGTYRFDPEKKETILMREKEEAKDYRYFPEPDLVPLILTEAYLEEVRLSLPELPHQRYLRYLSEHKLPADAAAILVNDKYLSDFFEEALEVCRSPVPLCNWLIVEFAGRLKELGKTLKESGLKSRYVAHLVKMIESGAITGKIAKLVADEMVLHPGKDSELIVRENPDFQPVHDRKAIEPFVDQVLRENTQSIADFKAGKTRAFGFLVGQVMKLTQGKASPEVVNALLNQKLQE